MILDNEPWMKNPTNTPPHGNITPGEPRSWPLWGIPLYITAAVAAGYAISIVIITIVWAVSDFLKKLLEYVQN